MRRGFIFGLLLCASVGCHVLSPTHLKGPRPAPEENSPEEPLMLASVCLERGDDAEAATHLAIHVRRFPEQLVFRLQLAELLLKLERYTDAQHHFEEFIVSAQDGSATMKSKLVHGHTRLMEIAEVREDSYAEHLHRGIGLYLVATELQVTDKDVQKLLLRASTELKDAQTLRPADGRVAWYLYLVWQKLDQPRPAEKCLRKAAAEAAFSSLTPAETRELALTTRR